MAVQNKTIVVYGASSYIGRKFILKAAKKGFNVVAVFKDPKKIPKQKLRLKGTMETILGDVTDKKDVNRALQNKKVDATINFAANFSTDYSMASKINVIGEKNIVDASIEFGVKRHIYISTIATLMTKATPYKDTKLKAENLVKKSDKKLYWIILRLGHVLGTPAWSKPFKTILPILRVAISTVPTNTKDVSFPYVTLDTAIGAILAALVARPNQLITVLDERISVKEYLSTMEKVYKVRGSYLPVWLLLLLNRLFGKFLPIFKGYAAAADFLAHPPLLENQTMKRQLHIKTRDFHSWIKDYFTNHE